jgi:GH43 family beta-xylosidase
MDKTERRRRTGWPCFGLVLALLLAPLAAAPAAEPVRDFYNVLAPTGADPWVIRHTDGRYYMTCTGGDRVTVSRSRTLSGLSAGERKTVWAPPRSGPYSREIWAPELHFLRGKWYVYFAADDGENANHRMYALENAEPDPFQGTFEMKGKVAPPGDDHWAIDGTAFEANGRLYFVWSGWEGDENLEQRLYIAPMSDPWTISGPRVVLSRPEYGWETVGHPNVNEGPQAVIHDGRVHLIYSASGAWTGSYCLGRLTARADRDLLDPASWRKSPDPVFRGANGIVAPGHCSFVRSPDGAEDWIVYHSAKYPGSVWDRTIRAQPFGWDASGLPDFGRPVPPDRPIRLPGGDPPRLRIELEGAKPGGVGVIEDAAASGGRAWMDPRGLVEVSVTAGQRGPHALAIRFSRRSARGGDRQRPSALTIEVNGQPAGRLRLSYTDGRWLVAYHRATLAEGSNTIRLRPEGEPVALDCLDVMPDP